MAFAHAFAIYSGILVWEQPRLCVLKQPPQTNYTA